MGSSPSSQQLGTSFRTHRTSSPHRLSPGQPQVYVAWGSQEGTGQAAPPNSDKNNEIMVCETCKANFNLLRRKYLCCDCKKHYCNACSAKEHKRCHNCLLFKCPITRQRLEELKIKDLRQYLNVHNVSTESCKEKRDLVELICNLINSRSTSNGPTGLSQGSANISQNRSGSMYTQSQTPHAVPQSGFTNLQHTAERLYNQAHQQFFGGTTGESEGILFRAGTSAPTFSSSQTVHPGPHGPFAPSQEQYSASSGRRPTAQRQPAPPPAAQPRPAPNQPTNPPAPAPQETSTTSEQATPQSSEGNQLTTAEDNNDTERQSTDPPPAKRRASLKDITKAEDIEELSVRQLKEILRANFVDFKGCVERYELLDRVNRLYTDREGIRAKEEKAANAEETDDPSAMPSEDDLCRICMDATIDCVLLECGHMVTCTTCGKQMNECPICRQYVIRCVHIFRS